MINFNDIAIYNLSTEFYHKQLFSPIGEKGLKYITNRGITESILKRFKIGFAGNGNELLQYLEKLGVNTIKCKNPLLKIHCSKDFGEDDEVSTCYMVDYFQNRIIFPIFNGEDVWSFTSRIVEENPKVKKHLHLPGKNVTYFNHNRLKEQQTIFVVESPINCLTLEGFDLPSIATMGVDGYKRSAISNFKGKTVFITYDNDKPGEQKALEFAKELYNIAKVDPFIVYLPKKELDINDYYLFCIENKLDFIKLFFEKSTINLFTDICDNIKLIPQLKIKDRYYQTDISTLLDDFKIQYRESNNAYIMKCPFHKDTNPSLYWYKDTKRFKCYSCGLSGNSVNFILNFIGKQRFVGFDEACQLAEQYNIK